MAQVLRQPSQGWFFIYCQRESAKSPGVTESGMPPGAANKEVSGPLGWLIYPGSRVLLNVANDDGSRLLQLISFDRIDKVIDWYIAKFSPSKQIGLADGGIILKGSFTTALILPGDQHTTVTVKRSGPGFGWARREPWR